MVNKRVGQIPRVQLIKAISPGSKYTFTDRFTYRNLQPELVRQSKYFATRRQALLAQEPGSLGRQYFEVELKQQEMLVTAAKLDKSENEKEREQLSRLFTKQSVGAYGKPNKIIASQLLAEQFAKLDSSSCLTKMQKDLLEELRIDNGISSFKLTESNSSEFDLKKVGLAFGSYIKLKYSPIFSIIDNQTTKNSNITPRLVAEIFSQALRILSTNYDATWRSWSVKTNDSATLSVNSEKRVIQIGLNRVNVNSDELKALVAHELLVHALRSVNGFHYSQDLGAGLSFYNEAEEGLGVLAEYAVTGIMPNKIIDRYVDIALALGLITGRLIQRKKLLEFVILRNTIRNQAEPTETQLGVDQISQRAHNHVARIYRGSLGNNYVGVFTKDIIYYDGFVKMVKNISDKLSQGGDKTEYFIFLLSGKFDPTNERHIAYIKDLNPRV